MNEEKQIEILEAQIAERDRLKAKLEKRELRRAFWKGDVLPVMVLFLLVALFLMLSQCSVIRIG